MGWGYFEGYEVMITVLGLFLYGIVPGLAVFLTGRFAHKELTFLAPFISLVILYGVAQLFLFLFSSAMMGDVFIWTYQFAASIAILCLFWFYELRARFACRRWTATIVGGFFLGIVVFISSLIFYWMILSSFRWSNPTGGIMPHLGSGLNVLVILTVVYYLAGILVVRTIHPKENPRERNVISPGLTVLVSAFVFILISVLLPQHTPLASSLLEDLTIWVPR